MQQVIGNAVRTQVLHELTTSGTSSVTQIADAIEVNRVTVFRHLQALEALGLVVADSPTSQRSGRHVQWTADVLQIRKAAQLWVDFAAGDSAGHAPR